MSIPREQSDPSACPNVEAGEGLPGDSEQSETPPAPDAPPEPRSDPAPGGGDTPEVAAWVQAAQDGDRDAFEALIGHFQDRVWRRALYRIRDHDEAQDVAQEVFLICFRKIHQFRGEAKFWTWMSRIVDNQVKNRQGWLQRRGKGRTYSLDSPPGSAEGDAPSWDVPDSAPDPRQRTEAKQAMEALNGNLDRMSEDHREILLLRFADGLSYEEIAETLQVSLGTVKSRINRGRAELRTLMGDYLKA